MALLSQRNPYIEIVNSNIMCGTYTHILFDFDGTLSLIREGWQRVMQQYFEEVIIAIPEASNYPYEYIQCTIREIIEKNTGKQTIYQCIALAEYVQRLGSQPMAAQEYKDEYQKRLLQKIQYRIEDLSINAKSRTKYLVKGSLDLLEMLSSHNAKLYLASGTDQEYVEKETKLLGLDKFFNNNIFGAQREYKTFSKKRVIRDILESYALNRTELLGIGDGYVEIENVKQVGGLTCAVCSDETGSGNIDKWKYKRLKTVGADMLISDYSDVDLLEQILFGTGYK